MLEKPKKLYHNSPYLKEREVFSSCPGELKKIGSKFYLDMDWECFECQQCFAEIRVGVGVAEEWKLLDDGLESHDSLGFLEAGWI